MNPPAHPVSIRPGGPSFSPLGWLRLGTVTVPQLVIFFVLAAVHESAAWIRSTLGEARRASGLTGATETAGSVVFVPAEVWTRSKVAVGQDDEAAVNGR